MKYVIMAAGQGKRWNNYLGVPKHLVIINGETLLGRTTRLLKENGVNDYIITCNDARYSAYGPITRQSSTDCEIDRFDKNITDDTVCYLYGDVYYTSNAIKTIVNTPVKKDILFFGGQYEIFAVKVENREMFFKHVSKVKQLFLDGAIDRCIGWEVYRSLHNIPFKKHQIKDRYHYILDGTDDIDYPCDYENFKKRMEDINND